MFFTRLSFMLQVNFSFHLSSFFSYSNLLSSFIPFRIISASLFSSAIFVKSSWPSFKPPTPNPFPSHSLSLSLVLRHTHTPISSSYIFLLLSLSLSLSLSHTQEPIQSFYITHALFFYILCSPLLHLLTYTFLVIPCIFLSFFLSFFLSSSTHLNLHL